MIVWLNPCPMCSVPVTLGGGSWMLKEGFSLSSVGVQAPLESHSGAHLASIAAGSKDLASSVIGTIGKGWRKPPAAGRGPPCVKACQRKAAGGSWQF